MAETAAQPKSSATKASATNSSSEAIESWLAGNTVVFLWLAALVFISGALALGLQFAGKRLLSLAQLSNIRTHATLTPKFESAAQSEAEQLLQRAAGNDASAPDQILAQSENWIGKTQRTTRANQLITAVLNSRDMHAREAAIQAELAMDGVTWNQSGLNTIEQAVGNPGQRAWALWTLGALGNRGVDPTHAAKVIGAYLSDPDANVRVSAVDGLAILGSDETVPMLLDRFRNDPSVVVQERAACGLAEAGMYTHEQRMVAVASMVNWLDDSLMTPQQRMWALQALRDISGQNLGMESAGWRRWYENAR